MAEQEYFKKALAEFAFDAAAGDAIRHLADLGMTVAQIAAKLDYPVKEEKIGKTVWEHFLKSGRIRREEPGNGVATEEYTYVTEYNAYGKKSFRKVKLAEHGAGKITFCERVFDASRFGEFTGYLREKCRENGEEKSYFTCDFARCRRQEPAAFATLMEVLGQREREYILGLPFEQVVYHQLDRRMQGIATALCGTGKYRGECWFLGSGERVVFNMAGRDAVRQG
ncbi:MAG: hypothetical protein K2N63_10170 [Lachnospiraceae bacterium]|nr:hypothetical protein [Lachnospiraceae bacterium]